MLNTGQASEQVGNRKQKKNIVGIHTNKNQEREADKGCCTTRFYQRSSNFVGFETGDCGFPTPS